MSEHYVWKVTNISGYTNKDIRDIENLYDEMIAAYHSSSKLFCKIINKGLHSYREATEHIIRYLAQE